MMVESFGLYLPPSLSLSLFSFWVFTFQTPPPTMVGLPPQFAYLNYPFSLLSVLEFGFSFTPILHAFFNPIFLSNYVRILGHLLGFFLYHFDPKTTRTVEKVYGPYLTVHNSFRKGFDGLFFPLSPASSCNDPLSSSFSHGLGFLSFS